MLRPHTATGARTGPRARSAWFAAVCVAWLFLSAPVLAAPAPAAPAPAAPPSALVTAQTCYASGDLGCVVRALEHAVVPESDAAERWRLLALAASRLDRHDLARAAFAAWIRLDPKHRLERDSTPPGVWLDYTAALLEVRGAELDRTPKLGVDTKVPPPRPTSADLPRAALPAHSGRDKARDFRFLAGVSASAALGQELPAPIDSVGGQLGIELQLSERWWVGPHLSGVRFALDGEPTTAALVQLQAAMGIGPAAAPWVSLTAGAGAQVGAGNDKLGTAALHVGLRYASQAKGVVGLAVELADEVVVGGSAYPSLHILTLRLGALIRPPRR